MLAVQKIFPIFWGKKKSFIYDIKTTISRSNLEEILAILRYKVAFEYCAI